MAAQFDAGTFIWTGLDTLQAILHNVSPRVTDFLGSSMSDVMDDVFEQSQSQVPVDTGALRSSGYVDEPEIEPGDIRIRIGYGAPYAWFVHENLAARHPHGGNAKFLENPLRQALNDLSSKLQGRLEAAVMGGGGGAGSNDHAAESTAMSKHSNTRSLARKRGMSSAHVEEAMQRLRENAHVHPELREEYSVSRNKLKRSFAKGPIVRHNYDPTRKGPRGDLQHPG